MTNLAELGFFLTKDSRQVAVYQCSQSSIMRWPPPPGAKAVVTFYDIDNGELLRRIQVSEGQNGNAILADNDTCLVHCYNNLTDRQIVCFDLKTGLRRGAIRHAGYSRVLAASPTRPWIAVELAEGTLGLIDVRSMNIIQSWAFSEPGQVEFSPDGILLAAADDCGTIRIWRAEDASLFQTIRAIPETTTGDRRSTSIAFSSDGQHLAYAYANTVQFWDLPNNSKLSIRIATKHCGITSLCFGLGNDLLLGLCNDGILRTWHTSSGVLLGERPQKGSSVRCTPDGTQVIGTSSVYSSVIRPLYVTAPESVPYRRMMLAGMTGSALTGQFAVAEWADKMVVFQPHQPLRVARITDGKVLRSLDWTPNGEGRAQCNKVAISPEGDLIAAVSENELVVFGGDDHMARHAVRTLRGDFQCVSISRDAKLIATGGGDIRTSLSTENLGPIVLWSADSLTPVWSPIESLANSGELGSTPSRKSVVSSLAFASDGQTLAAGWDDGRIQIWSVTNRALRREMRHSKAAVTSLAFSPREDFLASTSWEERRIHITEPSSGECVATLTELSDPQSRVAFSIDGTTLAAGGRSGIRLWNVPTFEQIAMLTEGTLSTYGSLAFCNHGKTLIASDLEASLHIWNAELVQPAER